MSKNALAASNKNLDRLIYEVRGHKVMLDADLAKVYGVTTGNLNKAVKRNPDRFPTDFMFQLTKEEASWAASDLFGSIISVGRCARSIIQAIVAVLPLPVMPSSV